MGILAFLKTITDIRSAGNLFLELIAFLKKNKLLPIVYLLPIITGLLYYIIFLLFINNRPIKIEDKRAEIGEFMDKNLKKCGNLTAMSISVVDNNGTRGRFYLAKACDEKQTGCIVNLSDANSLYDSQYQYDIDLNTYQLLEQLDGGRFVITVPKHFILNKDGVQDLTSIAYYRTLSTLVSQTNWGKAGIIKDLWITSSRSLNGNILYVFTFKTAIEKTSCESEIQDILIELRTKMGGAEWF
jgi:hypothetical protein